MLLGQEENCLFSKLEQVSFLGICTGWRWEGGRRGLDKSVIARSVLILDLESGGGIHHKANFLFHYWPISPLQITIKNRFSLKSPVVVAGRPLHQVHLGARHAADGPVPVVSDAHVQVAGVEVLKVLVERHKVLREERKQ